MTLTPDAAGDFNNAMFLGHAASLAYLSSDQGPEQFQTDLGLTAKLISVGNTQAYVCTNDRDLVVAFRGSESPATIDGFKDWLLTNANNYLVLPEGEVGRDFESAGVGARFHRGFMEAIAAIWEPLFAAVDAAKQENDRLLWVTGHSLGGALALMGAWRFQENFLDVHQVYTFGAPMIGNVAAAEALQERFPNKIFRFVDDGDMVPRLPTMSLIANEYKHCLTEIDLTTEAASATSVIQNLATKAVDGMLNLTVIDDLWQSLHGSIEAHLMPNYLSKIGKKCQ